MSCMPGECPIFDLPILRYRAMIYGVCAPRLSMRPYFNRYTETLHELCRVMGLHRTFDP
jgi:hypothetical protein